MITIGQLKDLIRDDKTGTVFLTDTVHVRHLDHINLGGTTLISSADPAFIIQGTHWSLADGKLVATNGVAFECVFSSVGVIRNLYCSSRNNTKSLFRCMGASSAYDTHIEGGEWEQSPSMTVPIIHVEVDKEYFNINSFSKIRFQTNGTPSAPVIKLATLSPSHWLIGNSFSDLNFEIATAGAIHLFSCAGTSMTNIQMFDSHIGSMTDHCIKVGRRNMSSLRSRGTSIRGYLRLGGSLPTQFSDIYAPEDMHYGNSFNVSNVGGNASFRTTIAP